MKKILFFLFFIPSFVFGQFWGQIGQDFNGISPNDEFGKSVSMSDDGEVVVISAPSNDSDKGYIRVFENVSGIWYQRGQDILGEFAGDRNGESVSVNQDGSVIAIGAPYNDGNTGYVYDNRGEVKIYSWDGVYWNQLGQDIEGEAAGDAFGYSLSLSNDGNTLLVGAYQPPFLTLNTGYVKVAGLFFSMKK